MPDSAPQIIPQRLAHNKAHMDKYLAAHGNPPLFPPVESQLETIVVQGLPPGAYNPSLVRFRGKLVMSYRFHETTLKTKLGLAELDEAFHVTSTQTLDCNEEESCEDARLFVFKNELWMNFVVSNWPTFPACQVKHAKLSKPDHWRISDKDLYWISNRQTMEKNHVPLIHDEVLHIVYAQSFPEPDGPQQIIFTPADKREMKNPALRWAYGEMRGGTVPMLFQPSGATVPKLLSFFHSRLDNNPFPVRHRYFIGAVLRRAIPPFDMLFISQRPILRGSEVGGDSARFHHKPNVVFPLGAVPCVPSVPGVPASWLLSVGINDSQAALVKITEQDLQL